MLAHLLRRQIMEPAFQVIKRILVGYPALDAGHDEEWRADHAAVELQAQQRGYRQAGALQQGQRAVLGLHIAVRKDRGAFGLDANDDTQGTFIGLQFGQQGDVRVTALAGLQTGDAGIDAAKGL